MATKEEKNRCKNLRREMVQQERAEAEASVPIAKSDLKALFDYVDAKLEEEGCDHTLKHTNAFLASRHLPQEQVIQWLAESGDFCDCEVIANSEGEWEWSIGNL